MRNLCPKCNTHIHYCTCEQSKLFIEVPDGTVPRRALLPSKCMRMVRVSPDGKDKRVRRCRWYRKHLSGLCEVHEKMRIASGGV